MSLLSFVALFPVFSIISAAPNALHQRAGTCQTTCLAAQVTGDAGVTASFCSNYLSYAPSTSVVTATSAPPPVTSTVTSTSLVTSLTTLPPSTITNTAFCTPSGVAPNTKRWWWNSPPAPVSSSPPAPPPAPSSTCSPASPPPAGAVCGATGVLTSPCLLKITQATCVNTCRDTCLATAGCNSFSFLQGVGVCNLFSKSISQQKLWQFPGPLVHYDTSCFTCSGPTPPPTPPSCAATAISSACSCLVTSPAVSTTTMTVVPTANTVKQTITVTSTSTSSVAGPVSTKSITLPNTESGTYTSPYGGTYAEFPYTDFNGGTMLSGECYSQGAGFDVSGTRVPCTNLRGCEDVCSYVNKNGGYNGQSCAGVSYHPNPQPNGYSTCYLKYRVPNNSTGYCGEYPQGERVDSAILLN